MIEINKAWNIAMGGLPSKPAAPKIKTQCSFFQRGICRFGDRCGDLHDDQPAPVASPTKEQKNRSKPKGKPAAAAVAVSVPKAHSPVLPEYHFSDTWQPDPTYPYLGGSATSYYIGDSDADDTEDSDSDDAAADRYWASSHHASRRAENPISCSRPSPWHSTCCPWRHLSWALGWEEQS